MAVSSLASSSRPPKLTCAKISDRVVENRRIGSGGDTIEVHARDDSGTRWLVARLSVPRGAVRESTEFRVAVPKGKRVVASVRARQGGKKFTGPFGAGGLQLTLFYDRKCSLNGAPAAEVPDLNAFRVKDSDEDQEDPDADAWKGGNNDGKVSITLALTSLSGYILAQGRQPPNSILPDSLPNPSRDSSGPASPDTASRRDP